MIRTIAILLIALPASANERLFDCRAIKNAELRLACYDGAVDELSAMESKQTVELRDDKPASTVPAAEVASEAPAGKDPSDEADTELAKPPAPPPMATTSSPSTTKEPTSKEPATTEPEPVDQFGKPEPRKEALNAISAAVTTVRKNSHKKLLITLDNQQIWQQLDSSTMRLHAGDKINIRSARLNSYLLRKAEGGRSIRVKRIQ